MIDEGIDDVGPVQQLGGLKQIRSNGDTAQYNTRNCSNSGGIIHSTVATVLFQKTVSDVDPVLFRPGQDPATESDRILIVSGSDPINTSNNRFIISQKVSNFFKY